MNQTVIKEARLWWDAGVGIRVGSVLYEKLPPDQRPIWAATILRHVYPCLGECIPEIETLLEIAETPSRWHEAAKAFSAIRLSRSKFFVGRLNELVKTMAEKVAKVTHNAADQQPPFDHHAGWLLVSDLYKVILLLEDDGFKRTAWETLVKPFKELD